MPPIGPQGTLLWTPLTEFHAEWRDCFPIFPYQCRAARRGTLCPEESPKRLRLQEKLRCHDVFGRFPKILAVNASSDGKDIYKEFVFLSRKVTDYLNKHCHFSSPSLYSKKVIEQLRKTLCFKLQIDYVTSRATCMTVPIKYEVQEKIPGNLTVR